MDQHTKYLTLYAHANHDLARLHSFTVTSNKGNVYLFSFVETPRKFIIARGMFTLKTIFTSG